MLSMVNPHTIYRIHYEGTPMTLQALVSAMDITDPLVTALAARWGIDITRGDILI